MFQPLNILTTACGAMFMHGFFKCLKENGERKIYIIGVDLSDDQLIDPLIDKFYTVPPYSDSKYIETLLSICRREKINVLFPHISMELPIVLSRIDDFKKSGVKVAISENKSLEVANNKYRLYEFLRSNNLDVPDYFLVNSVNSLKSNVLKLGYPDKPVCLKVAESSGSRGVRIIKSNISQANLFLNSKPTTLYTTLENMIDIFNDLNPIPEIIAMPYLPGPEYTVDLLADHGSVIAIAGRRNTVSQTSIAMESITEEKLDAYKLCRNIVSLLDLDGNIGFDFMLDEKDKPVLTDLNPRITATIILYKEAGINFPYLRVKQLMEEELPTCQIEYGVRMKRRYEEIFYKHDD
jgi:carbamoyl-phosphate synthase large subunit